jgi:DUF218 domain
MNSLVPNKFIVVLGQSLNSDGSPPPLLLDRLEEAERVYKEGRCRLILSGGDPANSGTSEALCMKQLLLARDIVQEHDIILDELSMDTGGNAWHCVNIVGELVKDDKEEGDGELVVVTSDFHLPRAMLFFESVLEHCELSTRVRLRGAAAPVSACDVSASSSRVNKMTRDDRSMLERQLLERYRERTHLKMRTGPADLVPVSQQALDNALNAVAPLLAVDIDQRVKQEEARQRHEQDEGNRCAIV